MCKTDPCFSGLDQNDVSPLSQPLTSEGSNVENVPPGQIRQPGRNNPLRGPNVVTLVGVHAEMSLTLILVSQRWFLSREWLSDPRDHCSWVFCPSGLGTLLSRVSPPPWLRTSRGHLGWPCSDSTTAAAPCSGRCVCVAHGAYRDTYLRHVEWVWPTAVWVFVTSRHDKLS